VLTQSGLQTLFSTFKQLMDSTSVQLLN